jgi:hypothetical protein
MMRRCQEFSNSKTLATFFGWNAEEPSCFWYTDELSDDFAKSWT